MKDKKTYSPQFFKEKKKELAQKKKLNLKIVSGSMEPIIMTDEFVTVEELNREPQRFDILTFYQNDIFICHYFWKKNTNFDNDGKNFITRALKSKASDIPFSEDQILGIVTNKKIGALRKFLIYLKEIF